MPNQITSSGLVTQTRDEMLAQITAALQTIYGSDIILTQDTPDGQFINVLIQIILDQTDLIRTVYNGFDPDLALGRTLDWRVAINGIQRQAGTYTVTNVTIVASQALTLYGLDQVQNEIYTVADNAGNKWQLISTQVIGAAGTYVLAFRAAVPGARLTIPNTITVPVSVVLGVDSINNPTTYTTLGINEETDQQLKIRRQISVALASQGYLKGLLAALENINGITSAFVYENNTDATDGDGIPSHSIWVIVAGTAPDADIANAIYTKRNAGAGMFGSQSYTLTQVDGTPFTVRWDTVEQETLYIKFTATSLDGINAPDISAIRSQLSSVFIPGVNEQLNINDLATAVQEIDNNTLVTNAGFSISPTGPFTNVISPSAKNKQFSITSPNIIIIPMIMAPSSAAVAPSGTQQFVAYGGYGAYAWTMDASPSGGSVDTNGLYTAGVGTGTDVVRATDTQGNFVTANIVVS